MFIHYHQKTLNGRCDGLLKYNIDKNRQKNFWMFSFFYESAMKINFYIFINIKCIFGHSSSPI